MKVHELQLSAIKPGKRVGRGIGSGKGKTAGRGTKGQNSRTGGGVRPGFEGGQNPLAKRLPKKRGFASLSRTVWQVVNLDQLHGFKAGSKVGVAELKAIGAVKHSDRPVKLLGQGELKHKLSLTLQAVSKTARAAVIAAGGEVTISVMGPLKQGAPKSAERAAITKANITKLSPKRK